MPTLPIRYLPIVIEFGTLEMVEWALTLHTHHLPLTIYSQTKDVLKLKLMAKFAKPTESILLANLQSPAVEWLFDDVYVGHPDKFKLLEQVITVSLENAYTVALDMLVHKRKIVYRAMIQHIADKLKDNVHVYEWLIDNKFNAQYSMIVCASAINFLLLSDGSATLRYSC